MRSRPSFALLWLRFASCAANCGVNLDPHKVREYGQGGGERGFQTLIDVRRDAWNAGSVVEFALGPGAAAPVSCWNVALDPPPALAAASDGDGSVLTLVLGERVCHGDECPDIGCSVKGSFGGVRSARLDGRDACATLPPPPPMRYQHCPSAAVFELVSYWEICAPAHRLPIVAVAACVPHCASCGRTRRACVPMRGRALQSLPTLRPRRRPAPTTCCR